MKKNKSHQGLNIIIVGCGKVGQTLTEQLIGEGHAITIIDSREDRIADITNMYDILGIVGNGASYQTQLEAGIDNADLLIAVTESDELNLLCCTIAKQVGHCDAIARVRTPDYSKESGYLREKLGLALIINPELEAAVEASRILSLPSALKVGAFAHGMAELIKFKIPEKNRLDGITLAELGKSLKTKILICAVEREGKAVIPNGNFLLKKDDIVSFVCPRKKVKAFLVEIGMGAKAVKDCMIVGGGKAAFYLASQLIGNGINVKIIERDRARCEELSTLLPEAIVINGDGTDVELLKEEGLETVQSFVALTGIDEGNVILTLHARHESNAKTITKIDRINFKDVVSSLDLGSVIYPKYITSERIIAYVRAKADSQDRNIETLYHMYSHQVEVIEFRVDKASNVTDIPLKDLKLKDNLLISCISRNGGVIIPNGLDEIKVGDSVMIVTTHLGYSNLEEILA